MTQLEALKLIAERDGGLLRPAAVVEAAKPVDSPLHNAFTWDDTKAANEYRLLQAQKLIRSFKVTIEDGDKKFDAPVFVNLSTDRVGGKDDNPYRLTESLRNDMDLLAIAEKDAMEQLRGVKERYGHLKRLCDIWDVIDSH